VADVLLSDQKKILFLLSHGALSNSVNPVLVVPNALEDTRFAKNKLVRPSRPLCPSWDL